MGKSPIPKTDYVMYFICWVTGGHFTRGFYCINLPLFNSCWSIYSGGGCRADDFKADSHSLDREDRQDFVIRCRTYSNSNSSDSDRGDRRNTSYQQILGISISIRSEISYWIAHSMSILNIMPWRGLEPPRSLARDFESRVSTISPPRHLESESYSMNMISI